jgi:hypothetical protein
VYEKAIRKMVVAWWICTTRCCEANGSKDQFASHLQSSTTSVFRF